MKGAPPTLADGIIREWLRPVYRDLDPDNWFGTTIARARKFVIDDDMSAFMADLAYASLKTCDTPHKAQLLIDGMRSLARLPHPVTWIEYNMKARGERSVHEYGSSLKLWEHIPDRGGWLIMQHPKIDTAFRVVPCVSHTFRGREWQALPQPHMIAYQWSVDDAAPPWVSLHDGDMRLFVDEEFTTIGRWLSGVSSYNSRAVSICQGPHAMNRTIVEDYLSSQPYHPVRELASDARYLWSLLATINDLPTVFSHVRPDKGYVARGRYRRFVEHHVIRLTVPQKVYRRVALRAVAISRRRAHQVRGHYRIDRHHRGIALCEHEYRSVDQAVVCNHCGRRRIWIAEHNRGDASLGFVLHDYGVTRGTSS